MSVLTSLTLRGFPSSTIRSNMIRFTSKLDPLLVQSSTLSLTKRFCSSVAELSSRRSSTSREVSQAVVPRQLTAALRSVAKTPRRMVLLVFSASCTSVPSYYSISVSLRIPLLSFEDLSLTPSPCSRSPGIWYRTIRERRDRSPHFPTATRTNRPKPQGRESLGSPFGQLLLHEGIPHVRTLKALSDQHRD